MGLRSWRAVVTILLGTVVMAACGDDAGDTTPGAGTSADGGETQAWSTLTEAPLEVTEVGATAFEGELWTAGGFTGDGGVTTAVQVYDPQTDTWRDGPDLPEPVHHASLVATDTDLVLVGGYPSIPFEAIADVFVLDRENGTWVEGPALPEPRGAGAAAWDGERLVYGGGIGPDGNLAVEIWALDDLDEGEWVETAQLSTARDHLAAASDGDGTVWFLGGRENSLETNLATVDEVVGDEAEHVGDLPTARGGVAAFFSSEHGACLAGGEMPDGTFAEVECIQPDGSTTALPSLSVPRHGLGAATIDGVAYVVLGGPEPQLAVSPTIEALQVD